MLNVGCSFNLRHLFLTPDPREYYTDCSVADAAGQALARLCCAQCCNEVGAAGQALGR